MHFPLSDFAAKLRGEIENGLPGTEVQWALASSDRLVKDFPRVPRYDSAVAAVLILIYPENGSLHTLFIQRPEYNGIHGGQISFPGGKMEPGDANLTATALREAAEETGVDPAEVEIIAILTPLFIHVSNIVVTPVIGWADSKPLLVPEENEVVFIIEAELAPFLDYSILKTRPFEIRGEMIDIKYFDYKGHIIWGATAMILHELLTILKRANLPVKE